MPKRPIRLPGVADRCVYMSTRKLKDMNVYKTQFLKAAIVISKSNFDLLYYQSKGSERLP